MVHEYSEMCADDAYGLMGSNAGGYRANFVLSHIPGERSIGGTSQYCARSKHPFICARARPCQKNIGRAGFHGLGSRQRIAALVHVSSCQGNANFERALG